MATNLVGLSVYQINQSRPIPLADVVRVAFPTQGCVVRDNFNSPTRALSTGISVYSSIQIPSGDKYYVMQTIAEVISAFNA